MDELGTLEQPLTTAAWQAIGAAIIHATSAGAAVDGARLPPAYGSGLALEGDSEFEVAWSGRRVQASLSSPARL